MRGRLRLVLGGGAFVLAALALLLALFLERVGARDLAGDLLHRALRGLGGRAAGRRVGARTLVLRHLVLGLVGALFRLMSASLSLTTDCLRLFLDRAQTLVRGLFELAAGVLQ